MPRMPACARARVPDVRAKVPEGHGVEEKTKPRPRTLLITCCSTALLTLQAGPQKQNSQRPRRRGSLDDLRRWRDRYLSRANRPPHRAAAWRLPVGLVVTGRMHWHFTRRAVVPQGGRHCVGSMEAPSCARARACMAGGEKGTGRRPSASRALGASRSPGARRCARHAVSVSRVRRGAGRLKRQRTAVVSQGFS